MSAVKKTIKNKRSSVKKKSIKRKAAVTKASPVKTSTNAASKKSIKAKSCTVAGGAGHAKDSENNLVNDICFWSGMQAGALKKMLNDKKRRAGAQNSSS